MKTKSPGGARACRPCRDAFAKTDAEAVRLTAALAQGGNMEHVHFNKGVAGRGEVLG